MDFMLQLSVVKDPLFLYFQYFWMESLESVFREMENWCWQCPPLSELLWLSMINPGGSKVLLLRDLSLYITQVGDV